MADGKSAPAAATPQAEKVRIRTLRPWAHKGREIAVGTVLKVDQATAERMLKAKPPKAEKVGRDVGETPEEADARTAEADKAMQARRADIRRSRDEVGGGGPAA